MSALIDYVRAAAALQGLALDEARVAAVAVHLERTAAMAAQLQAFALPPGAEPAALYEPAPFPAEDPA